MESEGHSCRTHVFARCRPSFARGRGWPRQVRIWRSLQRQRAPQPRHGLEESFQPECQRALLRLSGCRGQVARVGHCGQCLPTRATQGQRPHERPPRQPGEVLAASEVPRASRVSRGEEPLPRRLPSDGRDHRERAQPKRAAGVGQASRPGRDEALWRDTSCVLAELCNGLACLRALCSRTPGHALWNDWPAWANPWWSLSATLSNIQGKESIGKLSNSDSDKTGEDPCIDGHTRHKSS